MPRVVGAATDYNGHRDRLGDRLPELDVLLVGEDRALAGGARYDEAVAAVLGEPLGQLDGGVHVQGAVVVERRHHRCQH